MQVRILLQMALCMAAMAAVFSPQSEAAMPCDQVQGALGSCLGFLRGGALTLPCCNGVRAVAASARNTADRRSACRCLVAAAKAMRGVIDLGNAARLPARCGVPISFQISPNTDCSRYKTRFSSPLFVCYIKFII